MSAATPPAGEQVNPGPDIPGEPGRTFAHWFAPLMLILGGVLGWLFAYTVDHQPVNSDLWKWLLATSGLTALPLVGVAMRAPAYQSAHWRWDTAIAVIAAFLIVIAVIGICLHEIAAAPPDTASPGAPAPKPENVNFWRLHIASAGTGLILAALACGVVLDFFKKAAANT